MCLILAWKRTLLWKKSVISWEQKRVTIILKQLFNTEDQLGFGESLLLASFIFFLMLTYTQVFRFPNKYFTGLSHNILEEDHYPIVSSTNPRHQLANAPKKSRLAPGDCLALLSPTWNELIVCHWVSPAAAAQCGIHGLLLHHSERQINGCAEWWWRLPWTAAAHKLLGAVAKETHGAIWSLRRKASVVPVLVYWQKPD